MSQHPSTPRPLIGITGSRHHGRTMTLLNRFAVWRAGGRPVVVCPGEQRPREHEILDRLDGLVIGGGDDIDVHLHGGRPKLHTALDPERDALEMRALCRVGRRNRPVLGICRGVHVLNLFLGGTLHTDIHAVFEEAPRLRTILPRKRITVAPHSRLAHLLGIPTLRVNALHHQSVERLGSGLTVAARDAFDIVQAVEATTPPLRIGVQWHPEMLFYRGRQANLFRALVRAAREPGGTSTVDG